LNIRTYRHVDTAVSGIPGAGMNQLGQKGTSGLKGQGLSFFAVVIEVQGKRNGSGCQPDDQNSGYVFSDIKHHIKEPETRP